MAIVSLDTLLAGLKAGECFLKASTAAEGAGTFQSLWRVAGRPTAGAIPPAYTVGSGYTCDNTTTGALPFTNPTGGALSYLARAAAGCSTVGMLVLYDRMWTCSGFVTNSVSEQVVVTPGSLPARDSAGGTAGLGVELCGEVYSAPGATGATWTVKYTNQAGVDNRTATYTHPANAESVGQMLPFLLQSGDTGVQSVQSFTCSISSGTAGNIGLTLHRRIAEIPLTLANVGTLLDPTALGLPRLYDGSCLALSVMCGTTNTGLLTGSITVAQG